jgi:flagellar biosynthesis protein FliQ
MAFVQRHKLGVAVFLLVILVALLTFVAVGIFDALDQLKGVTKDFN